MAAVALILAACGGDSSTGSVNGSGPGESSYLNPNITYGTLSDSRDGQVYYTVVIGTQTWMAENLNYAVDSSWCYNNSADSCVKYGRLYQWASAMALPAAYNEATWGGSDVNHQGACPAGWHLPTNAEWIILGNAVGGEDVAGTALKSTSGWYDDGNGTDTYGFSALPAGYRYSSGDFHDVGGYAYFWGAAGDGTGLACYRYLNYGYEHVAPSNYGKDDAFSVRCLKN